MADVSVVIATHNRASKVKVAIDSVLAQSDPVREVIVVDDGSTDNTREQLLGYGNRIQALFLSQGGASAARNHGIRAAQGRWIAFLDDDDVWLAGKIARQMALTQENPAVRLVYCSDYAVDEQLRILYPRTASPACRGDVFEKLLVKNFIFTSCVMARRDAIEEAGYMDKGLTFAEDWDLWLKIAACHMVDFVDEPLVLYRQSASGCLTRDTRAADRLRDVETILDRALGLKTVLPETRRRARHELERQWAGCWLEEGKSRLALAHSVKTIMSRPGSLAGYRLLIYAVLLSGFPNWRRTAHGRR
jgi:glycosyltransferase involved in cell wall biosynthesis